MHGENTHLAFPFDDVIDMTVTISQSCYQPYHIQHLTRQIKQGAADLEHHKRNTSGR